jgi:hypothetical protein
MARRRGSGPLQVSIDDEAFQNAIRRWPKLTADRAVAVLDESESLILASVQNKTPVKSGRARASWHRVKFGAFSRGIVSFLIYIRRLELGRKGGRGAARMVLETKRQIPKMIEYAALKVMKCG